MQTDCQLAARAQTPPALTARPPQAALIELPDRIRLAALIERTLAVCRRQASNAALLLIEQAAPLDEPGLWPLLARRLRGNVRATDLVVQVGEQRFCLVLMGAGKAEARIVQTRLQRLLPGPYREDPALPQIQLQFGSAVYRSDGSTATALIAAAEAVLRA